jgi:N-acetylmuramoyl-L-alanine amidase
MRSYARLVVAAVALSSAVGVQAGAPSPRLLYTEALGRERLLRIEIEAAKNDLSPGMLLKRVRSLVDDYDRMSRRFPDSGYMDNAVWQGALLAADTFWTFGDADDKATALRMFTALGARFPASSLVKESQTHLNRLKRARPSPPALARAATAVSLSAVAPASGAIALTAIRRDVLPDAVRITLELAQEVPFRTGRIDGPARVFIDFDNTRPADAIKDATIPFLDDVVRKVRVGRQLDARTRVVMDLAGAGRHSVYALYNPYRVVVDFQRTTPAVPAVVLPSLAAREPGPRPVDDRETRPVVLAPASVSLSEPDVVVPPPPADEPPPAALEPDAPPTPPASNTSGGFSLSRQLGLRVSRIVIDPGHGGHDPGAKTRSLTEADLVLDVALKLEQLLSKLDGVEVVLTRRVDTFVPLEERTAIANREGADLFLSIHANASASTSARGVETYFLNLTTNPEAEAVAARENATSARNMNQLPDIVRAIALNNKIDESRDFASMIQASLSSQLQKADRDVRNLGVKQAPFMVLLGATMPSVLAEISFITNRQDAALLKTDKHRQRIAEALYAGVIRYQRSLKRVPAVAEQ